MKSQQSVMFSDIIMSKNTHMCSQLHFMSTHPFKHTGPLIFEVAQAGTSHIMLLLQHLMCEDIFSHCTLQLHAPLVPLANFASQNMSHRLSVFSPLSRLITPALLDLFVPCQVPSLQAILPIYPPLSVLRIVG